MKQVSGEGETWYRGPKRFRDPHPWEVEVLALIAEQIAIPLDQLASFLKITRPQAKKLMDEFVKYRWVEMRRLICADEPWIWLRQAGADHSGTGFGPKTPSIWGLPHRRAVNALRLELEALYPDGVWVCERSMWHGKAVAHHIPDAVFEIRSKNGRLEQWAIEAELSPKTMDRYREIAADRCARYDKVLYFCSPAVAKLMGRIPEVSKNQQITIRRFFQDPRQIRHFQWVWSPTSGPGEVPAYRHAESWEVEILRLIAEQEAIPVDQLARFLECDLAAAQRIADHLDAAGFVSQGHGPAGESAWLWVTKVGGRLAGTGLRFSCPTPASVASLRLMNEARLYVAERDWDVPWWSMRLLRRGALNRSVPTAVVEIDEQQHAVEVEYAHKGSTELIEKYNRRCSEFHAVALFCSSRRVETFEKMKKEHGWTNLFVRPFDALDAPKSRRSRDVRVVRLTEIALEELPEEALKVVQEAEGLLTSPRVKLVARYRGQGFPRWRVVTDSRAWRVARTPYGWFVRPCDSLNEEIAPPEPPPPPKQPKVRPEDLPKAPERTMKKVRPQSLPAEALEAIQKAAGSPLPPNVKSVERRRGPGFPRWSVVTDAGEWRVSQTPQHGWVAKLDGESEGPRCSRWPKDPPGMMVEIDPWEVPKEALEVIRDTGELLVAPQVISAEKRRGKGALRWRVVTDMDVWRVTFSPHGWSAGLSE